MEVLMGPTFSIGGDVSSSSSPYAVAPPTTQQEKHQLAVAAARCLFLKDQEDADGDGETSPISNCLGSDIHPDDSSDSSSIGAPDDSGEDEDDDEEDGAVSSKKNNVLGSLNSLEDALPTKRGLSNHFSGKSKSFTNLSEVNTVNAVKELEKPENPFNKRRRILMANKWSRRSFYSWSIPKSMPLLTTLHEDDDDSDKYHKEADQANKEKKKKNPSEEEEEEEDEALIIGRNKLQDRRFHKFGFKSQSCFSLSDLQEEGDEEEDDDP